MKILVNITTHYKKLFIIYKNLRSLCLCGAILLLVIISSSFCFGSTQTKISIIFSSDIKPYQQFSRGFKLFFAEKNITPLISEYYLDRQTPEIVIQRILMGNPDLVLTIGPQATILVNQKIRTVPVIFSMILDYREIKNPNSTGVYLDVSVKTKLEYIKMILPDVKRIGVIYSSKSISTYNKILEECDKMKYQLISRKVSSCKEFKSAFQKINGKIDTFLMVPDTKVYFDQSVKYLLLEGIRRKLPVIGLSSAYTKAGAFASLENNYFESGKQTGAMSLRIIHGTKPSRITPANPEHVNFSINLLVAARLGISIPSHIIEKSSEVFGK